MTRGSRRDRPTVAAFDVDGTLTRRDSVLPFLVRAAGPRLPLAFARRPTALARAIARRDRDALKRVACSALADVSVAEIRVRGTAFAEELLAHRLRADTADRLREHQRLGHATVLVSASLEPYLEPLGNLLAVDDVLCTRLEVGPDDRLTGELDGPNCRGEEKAVRLCAWLAETGRAEAELWAYGDSKGDDALLAVADHAIRVGRVRGRGMHRHAYNPRR